MIDPVSHRPTGPLRAAVLLRAVPPAAAVAILVILSGGVGSIRHAWGQPPAEAAPDSPGPPANTRAQAESRAESQAESPPDPQAESLPDPLLRQVRRWVDQLGDDQFAVRERASEQLYRLGHVALAELESSRRSSGDPEQVARLTRLIDTLSDQHLESRIDDFLRGEDVQLKNWSEVEQWFGDSPRVRELFVELYREHPLLVRSLDGTPQELSLALSTVRQRLIQRGAGQTQTPQRIDLLALLLPLTQPNFQADAQYDLITASLLRVFPAREFQNDRVFGEPFMRLVRAWMLESDRSIREQVLRQALEWEMDVALELALETIKQTPGPELLCRSMQAIAKQGNPAHARLLLPYLDDSSVVFRQRYLGATGGDVQVGDVAAAAIAVLHSVPVTEIGFAQPAEHPVLGIVYEELIVPLKEEPSGDEDPPAEEEAESPEPAEALSEAERRQREILEAYQARERGPGWEQIQQMRKESRLRDAARSEIREKARALVSQAEVPENAEQES